MRRLRYISQLFYLFVLFLLAFSFCVVVYYSLVEFAYFYFYFFPSKSLSILIPVFFFLDLPVAGTIEKWDVSWPYS